MTDFNVLFHHHPCHRLSKRRSGQRTCVCPIVIDVFREETCRVELGELHHAILDGKGWGYFILWNSKTKCLSRIPLFPKHHTLSFLISVHNSQESQSSVCTKQCLMPYLVSDCRQGIHQFLQTLMSLSNLWNQRYFLILHLHLKTTKLKDLMITHVGTFRKTAITASPFSSITASSNKLYLSEFQWTRWSCKEREQINIYPNMNETNSHISLMPFWFRLLQSFIHHTIPQLNRTRFCHKGLNQHQDKWTEHHSFLRWEWKHFTQYRIHLPHWNLSCYTQPDKSVVLRAVKRSHSHRH